MNAEIDLGGVFVTPALATALLALLVMALVHRILVWAGIFRLAWHPALFEAALFLIIWAGVTAWRAPNLLPH